MDAFAIVVRLPDGSGWEKVGNYFGQQEAAATYIRDNAATLDPSAKVVPVRIYGTSAQDVH